MYLPKPDARQTGKDVDEVYVSSSEDLRLASTAEKRRRAFRKALSRAYAAGVSAQHAIALEQLSKHLSGSTTGHDG